MFNGSNDIKIISSEKDKTKYSERGFDRGTQGVNIENAEFNLQTRGPDGVVYGCVGRIDENGDFLPQLYLIDALGFRLINSSTVAVASEFMYVL